MTMNPREEEEKADLHWWPMEDEICDCCGEFNLWECRTDNRWLWECRSCGAGGAQPFDFT